MNTIGRVVVAMAALGLLAGCAMKIDQARGLDAGGSDFTGGLYAGYLKLAESENAESDFADSDTFAGRAIAAAGGTANAPENIKARRLPADKVGVLSDARQRLVTALERGAGERLPAQAANAQVMYECWMQEQEENFQPQDIARCRTGFLDSMARVEAALKPAPRPMTARPKPVAKPKRGPRRMPGLYLVYFDFDRAVLTEMGRRTIDKAVAAGRGLGAGRAEVLGHTDRSGAASYNVGLSMRRARTVAAALAGAGLKVSVSTLAYGENKPRVPTVDGVREGLNRRVEIKLVK